MPQGLKHGRCLHGSHRHSVAWRNEASLPTKSICSTTCAMNLDSINLEQSKHVPLT